MQSQSKQARTPLVRRESRQDRRLKKMMAHLGMETLTVPGVGMRRREKKDAVSRMCREIDRLQARIKELENPHPRKVPSRSTKAVRGGN